MANYAGLSYGNQIICEADIEPHLSPTREITGITCFQIFNGGTPPASVTINNDSFSIEGGQTIDVIIKSVQLLTTNICLVCTCHDCHNPDGNAQRAVTWLSGATAPTLINPSSPYTLIGSGFLNS